MEQGKHAELLAKVVDGEDESSDEDEDNADGEVAGMTTSDNPFKADPFKSKDAEVLAETTEDTAKPNKKVFRTSYKRLWNAATGENEKGMTVNKVAEKLETARQTVERLEKKAERIQKRSLAREQKEKQKQKAASASKD